jgi:hypothetical protein
VVTHMFKGKSGEVTRVQAMKVYGGAEVSRQSFLNWTLGGAEWST